ncbi:hypothetical protein BKA61DRAFT_583312 [Leptodontidium sp. MPI-SDFR-AT-0119]|nr:hypothetical protein BKA61DRAFT_583312 [Leptodontidium sp. MPI-SDFR-AT-0119]
MHWKFLSRQSSPVSGLMMAKLLETFTKKNNYEYDTAENGLLALQAFQNTQNSYDIVFMDISMPVMNGIDSTRGIRKLESKRGQKLAMIVALTGLASASVRQEAFSRHKLFPDKTSQFQRAPEVSE